MIHFMSQKVSILNAPEVWKIRFGKKYCAFSTGSCGRILAIKFLIGWHLFHFFYKNFWKKNLPSCHLNIGNGGVEMDCLNGGVERRWSNLNYPSPPPTGPRQWRKKNKFIPNQSVVRSGVLPTSKSYFVFL